MNFTQFFSAVNFDAVWFQKNKSNCNLDKQNHNNKRDLNKKRDRKKLNCNLNKLERNESSNYIVAAAPT